MRVLFVGTLQLRKGIQYLLEAKRLLRAEPITIRLVGPSRLSEMALRQLRREVEVVGPIPRSELASHYAWADIFVLPTLSEGAANVCHEAMAAGLPLITTPNAGSIVRNGLDGHIVPIRNAAALCEAIEDLRSNVARRAEFGLNAAAAASRAGFAGYSAAIATVIRNTSEKSPNQASIE